MNQLHEKSCLYMDNNNTRSTTDHRNNNNTSRNKSSTKATLATLHNLTQGEYQDNNSSNSNRSSNISNHITDIHSNSIRNNRLIEQEKDILQQYKELAPLVNTTSSSDNNDADEGIICVLGIISGLLELGNTDRSIKEEEIIRSLALPLIQISLNDTNIDIAHMANELSTMIWQRSLNSSVDSNNNNSSSDNNGSNKNSSKATNATINKPIVEPISNKNNSNLNISTNTDDINSMIQKMKKECSSNLTASPSHRAYAIHIVLNIFKQQFPSKPHNSNNNNNIKESVDNNVNSNINTTNPSNNNDNAMTSETITNNSTILSVLHYFVSFLDDSESYVYLSAIHAISTVSDRCRSQVLPILISLFATGEFSQIHSSGSGSSITTTFAAMNTDEVLTHRARALVGECLCKILRQINNHSNIGSLLLSPLLPILVQTALKLARIRPQVSDLISFERHINLQKLKIVNNRHVTDDNTNNDEDRITNEGIETSENILKSSINMADSILLRQSSLSLLAEIIVFTGWSFKMFLSDILDLVTGILTLETSNNVTHRNKKLNTNNSSDDTQTSHTQESMQAALNIRRLVPFSLYALFTY